MIVFIALILVAAVAAAVIIQTAEKLQQNAQNTGAETTNMLSSKVMVLSVMVTETATDLYITFELAPGSADIAPADIDYSIVCEDACSLRHLWECRDSLVMTLVLDAGSVRGSHDLRPENRHQVLQASVLVNLWQMKPIHS